MPRIAMSLRSASASRSARSRNRVAASEGPKNANNSTASRRASNRAVMKICDGLLKAESPGHAPFVDEVEGIAWRRTVGVER